MSCIGHETVHGTNAISHFYGALYLRCDQGLEHTGIYSWSEIVSHVMRLLMIFVLTEYLL